MIYSPAEPEGLGL